MIRIGVVAIGRNEGERLRLCLASVVGRAEAVVYVDSGSTDGSVALARSMGAEVVELDLSTPFTAARARNAGFERMRALAPGLPYVQFVDGDCELVDGWLAGAEAELDARPDAAVVCGRVRERFPDRSIYNRLADIEWDTPIGEALACGGIAAIRAEALRRSGGYDPSLIAGEEPELCARLRGEGWKVVRLDAEMARHDIDMTRLAQWWRRQVRSGYGGLAVTLKLGGGPFARQVRSVWIWTAGWLLALGALGLGAARSGGPALPSAFGLIAAAPALQALRMAIRSRARVRDARDAMAYGLLIIAGKWAELAGQLGYARDRALNRRALLIEYKAGVTPRNGPPATGRGSRRSVTERPIEGRAMFEKAVTREEAVTRVEVRGG